jgi:hypothetical protein
VPCGAGHHQLGVLVTVLYRALQSATQKPGNICQNHPVALWGTGKVVHQRLALD